MHTYKMAGMRLQRQRVLLSFLSVLLTSSNSVLGTTFGSRALGIISKHRTSATVGAASANHAATEREQKRTQLLSTVNKYSQEDWDDGRIAQDDADDPHPLRMRDWEIQPPTYTLWSEDGKQQDVEMRLSPWKSHRQHVTFNRNGTVSTSEGHRGEWWFDVGGLFWDVNATVGAAPTVFHHKAELHWNVFGSEPRMFRGTVTRDRTHKSFLPPWLFRPVVSSFVGAGVGEDTSDTSYRYRQDTSQDEVPPIRVPQQTDRY